MTLLIGPRRSLLPPVKDDGSWTPADLSGLVLWLDATDLSYLYQDSAKTTPVTSDGDVVGCWADKSGNGNDVTQDTTANKPLYKTAIQNSEPALYFDGSNDNLAGTLASALSQPFHIFAIGKIHEDFVNGQAASSMIIYGSDATHRSNIFNYVVGDPDKWGISAGTVLNSNVAADTNCHIFTALFNGASSNIRIDGDSKATGNAGAENPAGVNIGSQTPGSQSWKGYILEILIYDPNLGATDLGTLEAWLATKWGITIA